MPFASNLLHNIFFLRELFKVFHVKFSCLVSLIHSILEVFGKQKAIIEFFQFSHLQKGVDVEHLEEITSINNGHLFTALRNLL